MPVTEFSLRNAFEISLDEVMHLNDVSKQELQDFQKRFNNLLDLLKQEANEEPDDEDRS